jgi:DNA-binding Lrp family transcriptional regulator
MVRRDLAALFTKIASWTLIYVPLVFILLIGFNALNQVLTYGAGSIVQILTGTISTIVLLFILMIFGDWLGTLSERLDDEVEKELVGFLLSSGGPSPAGKVAEYLNISSKHAIKTFFKAKSKGMLKEFTFDSDNKEIIPPALQAQTVTERPTVSSMSTIADELLKGAKLKELERLKASGKISEEAYRELRKEIEGT